MPVSCLVHFHCKPIPDMNPHITITPQSPATVYYCKANIATGTTVILLHRGEKTALRGVKFHGVTGEMIHDNSSGKAKKSGARCVFQVTSGVIELIP